jgi:hypothetical protein
MEGYLEVDEVARRLSLSPAQVRRILREYYFPKEGKPKDKGLRGEVVGGSDEKRGRWLIKEDSLQHFRRDPVTRPSRWKK